MAADHRRRSTDRHAMTQQRASRCPEPSGLTKLGRPAFQRLQRLLFSGRSVGRRPYGCAPFWGCKFAPFYRKNFGACEEAVNRVIAATGPRQTGDPARFFECLNTPFRGVRRPAFKVGNLLVRRIAAHGFRVTEIKNQRVGHHLGIVVQRPVTTHAFQPAPALARPLRGLDQPQVVVVR